MPETDQEVVILHAHDIAYLAALVECDAGHPYGRKRVVLDALSQAYRAADQCHGHHVTIVVKTTASAWRVRASAETVQDEHRKDGERRHAKRTAAPKPVQEGE